MIVGKCFISTGFVKRARSGYWHALLAIHRRWRVGFVRPSQKPSYRRLYLGPFEIEWSVRP